MEVISFTLDIVDRIYNVYKAAKEEDEDLFAPTYKRATHLIEVIHAMNDADRKSLASHLDKMADVTSALLKYLEEYAQYKKAHKVKHAAKKLLHASDLAARIDRFHRELDALFQVYHLAMGAQMIKDNKELLSGVRELLQATKGADEDNEDEDVDEPLLALPPAEGPRTVAMDMATLLEQLADAAHADEATLALCAMAEADPDTFLKTDAVDKLVAALATGSGNHTSSSQANSNSPAISMALRVLYRLARVAEFEIAIVQAGAMAQVSQLLLADGTSDTRAALCATLARLLVQADHKRQLVTTEPLLLKKVVALVHNGSPTEKLHAVVVVGRVAEDHVDGARRIAQLKTIPVLIDALYLGKTPRMRLAALRALWSLSSLEGNNAAVVDEGGVAAIVKHLYDNQSDATRQLAASTLAWLAQDEAHDPLIGEAGAIPPLVELLISGTQEQRNSAVWALAELADHAGNAVMILDEPGAARALLAAFRSADDVVQRAKAGCCLAWLAQFAPDKAVFVKQLGLRSLVQLLDASTTDQRQNAARVLRFLVEDVSVRKKAYEMNLINKLLGLVQHHSLMKPAADALCAFVEGEDVMPCNRITLFRRRFSLGLTILTQALGDCAGYNQAANDLSQDKSDEFASVGKALLRIAESSHSLKRVVELDGMEIAFHALDKGSLPMQVEAVAFLARLTRQWMGTTECATVFTQLLKDLTREASPSYHRMVVYAAHWLIVVRPHRVELFTRSVLMILAQHLDDHELQELCAEALYVLAQRYPEAVQLDQVLDPQCVVNALDGANKVVGKYVVQTLITWSKASSNATKLRCSTVNKAVTWALASGDSDLVLHALEMLCRLPPRYRWVDLPAATKDAVMTRCFEGCDSDETSDGRERWLMTLANIYEALEAMAKAKVEARVSRLAHSSPDIVAQLYRDAARDDLEAQKFVARVRAADAVESLILGLGTLGAGDPDVLRIGGLARALAQDDEVLRQKLATQCQRFTDILKASGDVTECAAAADLLVWLLPFVEDGDKIQRMALPMLKLLFTYETKDQLDLVSDFVKLLRSCRTPRWHGVVSMVLTQLVEIAIAPHGNDKPSEAALDLIGDMLRDSDEDGALQVEACVIAIENCTAAIRHAAEKRLLSASDERVISLLGSLVDMRSNSQAGDACARLTADRGLVGPLLELLRVAATGAFRGWTHRRHETRHSFSEPADRRETTHWWLLVVIDAVLILDKASQLEACCNVVSLVSDVERSIEERIVAAELVARCVRDQPDALPAAVGAGMVGAFASLLESLWVPDNLGLVVERMASEGMLEETARLVRLAVDVYLRNYSGERAIRFLESITSVFDTYGDLGVVQQCASALRATRGFRSERAADVLAVLASSRRCCAAMGKSGVVGTLVFLFCRSPDCSFVRALGAIAKQDATLCAEISTDALLRHVLAFARKDHRHNGDAMETLVVLCTSHEIIPRLGPNLLKDCVKIMDTCEDAPDVLQFLTFLAEDESFGRAMASDDRIVSKMLVLLRNDQVNTWSELIRLTGLLARHEAARTSMVEAGVQMILADLVNDPECSKEAEQTLNVLRRVMTPAAAAF